MLVSDVPQVLDQAEGFIHISTPHFTRNSRVESKRSATRVDRFTHSSPQGALRKRLFGTHASNRSSSDPAAGLLQFVEVHVEPHYYVRLYEASESRC
jgi:hypothetical protein